jgi:CBS domain-containing protein
MSDSSKRTDPNPASAQHEAAASSVHHIGPTADRYHSAMVRYLNAIAGDAARHHLGPVTRRAPLTLVGDVMTTAVVPAHADAAFKEIVALMARNAVGALPVIDEDRKVIGVVSSSDLMAHIASDGDGPPRPQRDRPSLVGKRSVARRKAHAATARELMSAPPVTTRPHASIVEAARTAARAGVRHLPVVDGNGVLIGIVSRRDLLQVFLREDDDIRGEIEQYARRTMRLDPAAWAVAVSDGVVTLTGKLDRALQVGKLVNHVRGVSGVVDVDNRLSARFDDRFFPAPREVR